MRTHAVRSVFCITNGKFHSIQNCSYGFFHKKQFIWWDCFVDNKLESKESFIFPLRKLFVYLITKHNLANANRCKQLSNQLNISSNCNIIENQSMHLIMASNPIGCIEVIHNIFLPFSFIKQFNWPFWLSGLHLDTLHNRKLGMLRQ